MNIKMHPRTRLTKLRSKSRSLVLIGIALTIGYTGWSQTQPLSDSFTIKGDIPTSMSLNSGDLDKMPQETASVQDEDGTTVKYSGVLLRTILEKAGAPIGKSLRGKGLASYILAKARDGYQVVFTPGELDTSFGNERVLIAYKRDGKPLFGYQGPFQILCPNDKAGARSIRMLETLEVVRLRK